MTKLEYSFIRTEANNKIIMFIKSNPDWESKEMDIILNEQDELQITIDNTVYTTGKVEPILYHSLANESIKIVFCDEDANPLMECELNPLKPVKKLKY